MRRPVLHLVTLSPCHFFPLDGAAAAVVAAPGLAGIAPFAGMAAPLAGAVPAAGAAPVAGTTAPAAPSATSSFTALATSSLRCATFGRPKGLLLSSHFS